MDARLRELIARSLEADGSPPFSDGALVAGDRETVWLEDAAALASASEAEFVVHPAARRNGLGGRMLALLLERGIDLFWAHGDHPGARALARAHGLVAARTLLHLEAPVPLPKRRNADPVSAESGPAGRGVGRISVISEGDGDLDAWVALNARAFADHPEQGRVTRRELDALMSEPWFDADDFLLLHDGDDLVGYCWLKGDEFYVVGVAPERQGEGWGRVLVEAGFERLASRGIPMAHLYVEGDNEPALNLYRRYGFAERSVDIQYRREPR